MQTWSGNEITKKQIDKQMGYEKKMTREEAYNKLPIMEQGITRDHLLNALEALNLIKFEEEKKPIQVIRINRISGYPNIAIEEWPEGLVLWVGGEIKWKSWETYFTSKDLYNKHLANNSPNDEKCITIFGYTLKEIAGFIERKSPGS